MKLRMVKLVTEYFANPDNTYPGWCGLRASIGIGKGRLKYSKLCLSRLMCCGTRRIMTFVTFLPSTTTT